MMGERPDHNKIRAILQDKEITVAARLVEIKQEQAILAAEVNWLEAARGEIRRLLLELPTEDKDNG